MKQLFGCHLFHILFMYIKQILATNILHVFFIQLAVIQYLGFFLVNKRIKLLLIVLVSLLFMNFFS